MKDDHGLEETVDALERLMPRVLRRLFFDLSEDSPLWDLPVPQLRLMGMLSHRDNRRMSEVAECLGVAMSTATQVADRLEARGWVRRAPDPEDRRVVLLALTEEGRRLTAERREARRRRLRRTLAQLDDGERC